jgi:hypothetical protein
LAKPNFQYEKRQRELEKKRKKEQNKLRKVNETNPPDKEPGETPPAEGVPAP